MIHFINIGINCCARLNKLNFGSNCQNCFNNLSDNNTAHKWGELYMVVNQRLHNIQFIIISTTLTTIVFAAQRHRNMGPTGNANFRELLLVRTRLRQPQD